MILVKFTQPFQPQDKISLASPLKTVVSALTFKDKAREFRVN